MDVCIYILSINYSAHMSLICMLSICVRFPGEEYFSYSQPVGLRPLNLFLIQFGMSIGVTLVQFMFGQS